MRDNVAMLVGMCLFVGLNYLSQRFFAFREKPKDAAASDDGGNIAAKKNNDDNKNTDESEKINEISTCRREEALDNT